MKKFYETPVAEKVTFQYQEQVTASGSSCDTQVTNIVGLDGNCTEGNKEYVKLQF